MAQFSRYALESRCRWSATLEPSINSLSQRGIGHGRRVNRRQCCNRLASDGARIAPGLGPSPPPAACALRNSVGVQAPAKFRDRRPWLVSCASRQIASSSTRISCLFDEKIPGPSVSVLVAGRRSLEFDPPVVPDQFYALAGQVRPEASDLLLCNLPPSDQQRDRPLHPAVQGVVRKQVHPERRDCRPAATPSSARTSAVLPGSSSDRCASCWSTESKSESRESDAQ